MEARTIIVIDDESDTRVYLFELLRSEGYKVVTFENPYEALTRIHEIKPALVVLDVRMPQVNGIDFLPSIKTAVPDTPVLILTAYGNLDLFMEARSKGACEMLGKPFKAATLLKTVAKILGSSTVKP